MSNLKIGPVDITSGTAKLDAYGLQVGVNQFIANLDGSVTLAGNSTVSSTSWNISTGSSHCIMSLGSSAGFYKQLVFRTGTQSRWSVFTNNDPETGGNLGSSLLIARYSDAGNYIDSPILIGRSDGAVVVSTSLIVPTLDVIANDNRAANSTFVKNCLLNIQDRATGDSSNAAANTRFVQDAIAQRSASPKGRVIWTTPGTYTWTAPIGVTEIFVDGSAGGGGATANIQAMANGGRGESCYKYLVSVTPGTSYTVIVGSGGESTASNPYQTSSAGSGGSTAIVGKLTLAGGGGARVIGVGGSGTIPGISKYPIDVSPTFTLSDGSIPGMGGIGISSGFNVETSPATGGFLLITW